VFSEIAEYGKGYGYWPSKGEPGAQERAIGVTRRREYRGEYSHYMASVCSPCFHILLDRAVGCTSAIVEQG